MSENLPAAIGQLPISNALAEASPDSLTELFSRDPESYGERDISAIVAAMRVQRARFAQAEAEGKPAPRAAKSPKPAIDLKKSTTSHKSLDDLGL